MSPSIQDFTPAQQQQEALSEAGRGIVGVPVEDVR